MKIAILGAGNIGGTLGQKWAAAGHAIMFGLRETRSAKTLAFLKSLEGRAAIGTVGETLDFGEVALLAIPGAAVEEIAQANRSRLDGKLLIDATNQFQKPVVNNLGVLALAAPNARLYRAFNATGWEVFANPLFGDQPADLFFCGPDTPDRQVMEGLVAAVGLRPVYVGGLDRAGVVDALGQLWISLVFNQGLGRHMAFKMLS